MEKLLVDILTAILQNFEQNMKAYLSAIALFIFVALSRIPPPGVKWTKAVIYTWFYDTVQTLLPINRLPNNHSFQFPMQQNDTTKTEIKMPMRYGVK